MPRKRKTPKDPKIHEFRGRQDRISNLPIEIIRQIHCYLPVKDAARISVLSHKWQSIWASSPNIYLDEIDFGANFQQYSNRDKAKRNAFLTYLQKSLDRCNNCEEQGIIFPDELNETLLPTINDLKTMELRIDSSTVTSQQILDGFVWILPGLKTLSLTLGSITKFIEFPP
ncbi:FBD-associated F-box protein At5g22730-like isoform X2 [Lycium barbarum]|uniref:FBD-associated F-box protein At5g22730-like isoform X2 n=1 Tax=Lycium barbarum TaxID=112863 RepID=UPI00293E835D|nr:FBD-associated F-box protein At5g22730-like isoform X2 [Lycium barbarum]